MKKHLLSIVIAALGFFTATVLAPLPEARAAQVPFEAPVVFQAAGPADTLIQAAIDAFRLELGGINNANNAGQTTGRREINWDGGGAIDTSPNPPETPFNGFLLIRGAQFTTRGQGLTQATAAGLATLFNNPTYETNFVPFSPQRMFTPVGSNVTEVLFFVPGAADEASAVPAAVTGFGAVFVDVDQPEGSGGRQAGRRASTVLEFFDASDRRLFVGAAPAAPGDGNLSFLGIVFPDARIARVRITAGAVPGQDESSRRDIVVMDDFIYGEPQELSAPSVASVPLEQ
jgi:hypothetical protein